MINYFYNIRLKDEKIDFYSDVLTNIRKDFYLSKQKQKGKITQNSDADYINYEFCLEKDKMLRWSVSDNRSIISESRQKDDGKYGVNYYEDNGASRVLTFSKFHTLLRIDYYDTKISTSPHTSIEPRKNNDDLCLLISKKSTYASTVLYPMPEIDDEYILDKIDTEFEGYTAVASTNVGMVKFLSDEQMSSFETFVEEAKKQKEIDFAPKSFIDEKDAELANILNPKDFNIKKNLSQAIDITMAEEFSFDIEDVIVDIVRDDYSEVTEKLDFIDFVEGCNPSPAKTENALANENVSSVETDEKEIDVDLCEEIVSEPVELETEIAETTVDAKLSDELVVETEIESENETQVGETQVDEILETETVEPVYEVSPMQAEIDALFNQEESVSTGTDDILAVYDAPVVAENPHIVENTLDEEIEVSQINETIEDVVPEDNEPAPQEVNICDDATETAESFDVEQQEIPDCIIESSSTRYLYFGELDEKGNRCGFGRTATDNGRTAYEGGYIDNKRDGLGAYYYKDGELCYYGEWKDNKRDGFGIGISSVDKSAHIGRFVDNKPDSYGVRVDRNGEVRFVKKALSDGNYVIVKFDNDRIIITKYSKNGDVISDNSSNMMYF